MTPVPPHREKLRPLSLASLVLVNQGFFYAINIVLARQLSGAAFGRYCVAVSTTLILSTIATLGLEKYALRYLPPLLERGEDALISSYWKFSLRTIVQVSVVLIAVFALGMAGSLWATDGDPRFVLLYLVVFLPAIGLFLFMVEVVTASGAPLAAAAVYRVVFPATLLSSIVLLWLTRLPLTATTALLAFGIAWTVAVFLLWRIVRTRLPVATKEPTAAAQPLEWLRSSVPFLLNSMLMTLLAQSGVVILALVSTADSDVGRYAVAAQIGTFIVPLATSTNRYYLPRLAILMERRDRDGILRLARERLQLIGGISALYVLGVLAFGTSILRVFGPEFVEAYPALCWITGGAAVSTIFSAAPYYLQFVGRNVLVLGATAVAVAVSVVLCLALGKPLGSLGAAVAYSVPLAALFVTLRILGFRQLRRHWNTEATGI